MTAIVIDCRRYPGDNYFGNRVVRTDEEVEDLGTYWFESRALNIAHRHSPTIPSYHLKVERLPGFWPRYSVKAYQNRLEPDDQVPPSD
jgi:hypothetical protein